MEASITTTLGRTAPGIKLAPIVEKPNGQARRLHLQDMFGPASAQRRWKSISPIKRSDTSTNKSAKKNFKATSITSTNNQGVGRPSRKLPRHKSCVKRGGFKTATKSYSIPTCRKRTLRLAG